jgi:glutathione gamma-glutamylcysteinyltransferase
MPLLKSFHRRTLPSPPAIAFSSPEGKDVFKNALESGHMDGYFPLAEQFGTQAEPAFCCLATLSMVLNAFEIDPYRIWKGVWRWYDESMLDCCTPLKQVQETGLTFPEALCLAKCHRLKLEDVGFGGSNVEEFRNAVIRATKWEKGQPQVHLIVSYSRKTFLQSGDGHYSPIGGYCPERDLVLIMDVARFKYPPHWVSLELLCESMQLIDTETGKPRGWMLLTPEEVDDSKSDLEDSSKPLYFLLLNHQNDWAGLAKSLSSKLQQQICGASGDSGCACKSEQEVSLVQCFCEQLPEDFVAEISNFVKIFGVNYIPPEIADQVRQLREELHSIALYKIMQEILQSSRSNSQRILDSFETPEIAAEQMTMLLLSFPQSLFPVNSMSEKCHSTFFQATGKDQFEHLPLLFKEVTVLRSQMSMLMNYCGGKCSKSHDNCNRNDK